MDRDLKPAPLIDLLCNAWEESPRSQLFHRAWRHRSGVFCIEHLPKRTVSNPDPDAMPLWVQVESKRPYRVSKLKHAWGGRRWDSWGRFKTLEQAQAAVARRIAKYGEPT